MTPKQHVKTRFSYFGLENMPINLDLDRTITTDIRRLFEMKSLIILETEDLH